MYPFILQQDTWFEEQNMSHISALTYSLAKHLYAIHKLHNCMWQPWVQQITPFLLHIENQRDWAAKILPASHPHWFRSKERLSPWTETTVTQAGAPDYQKATFWGQDGDVSSFVKKLFSRFFWLSRTPQLLSFTVFYSVIKVIFMSLTFPNLCLGLPSSRAPHLTIHLTYLAQLYWYCYASKFFKDPVPSCSALKWKLGCIIVTIILSFPTCTLGEDQVPSCWEVLWLKNPLLLLP